MAASVTPDENREYARERHWLRTDESFDRSRVVARLHEQVTTGSIGVVRESKALS